MPIFNQAILVAKPPAAVSDVIKAMAGSDDQLITLRPETLLIALRGKWGYIYVLQPKEGQATEVRLIVDHSDTIRDAFRGRDIKEALIHILKTPLDDPHQMAADSAGEHLASLKQRAEQGWLDQSDAAPIITATKPQPEVRPAGSNPWNPDSFSFLYLFNSMFAGIAFALNWRRLGKPGWVMPTIGLSLLPLLAIPVLFTQPHPSLAWFKIALFMLILGSGWGVVLGLTSLQKGAYRYWLEGGDLTTYDYNIDRAAIIGLLATVVFSVLTSGFAYMTTRPTIHESADLTVTIPSIWAVHNTDDLPMCRTPAEFECLLAVADEQFGSTTVVIGKYPSSLGLTSEQIAANARNYVVGNGAEILIRDTTEVDGLTAFRFYFTLPADDDLHYGMQLHVGVANGVYEITAVSRNKDIYLEREDDINQLIRGVDFK